MSIRKTLVTVVIATSFMSMTAWAQPGRHGGNPRGRGGPDFRPMPPRHVYSHPPVGARHIIIGGRPYWVHGGVYYVLGDDGYVVVGAPVVRILPPSYHVVVIHGVVYYVADDVYYRPGPGGYVVVEKPVEPAQVVVKTPEPQPAAVTLYVPKKDGDGFVSVTLKKIDGGYLGPQGEFYPTMPRVSLLTEMYGISDLLRETPSDTYFIHVPNKDGQTYTRVALTRRNNGFVGPQGEFYPIMPSVAHLAEMYGTSTEFVRDAGAPVSKEPAKTEEATVHVQIHKKNGQGTVDVILKKRDQGFIGPQGEFYPEMPTPSQLADVYGAD